MDKLKGLGWEQGKITPGRKLLTKLAIENSVPDASKKSTCSRIASQPMACHAGFSWALTQQITPKAVKLSAAACVKQLFMYTKKKQWWFHLQESLHDT